MLQNTKELYGTKLAAIDGDIGHLKDFYFDDKSWSVRYIIADTGSWLTGRLVLLSPHAFAKLDQYEKTLHVKLTKAQIQNSPSIDQHKPVSRQYEEDYYRYYGWPTYWDGGGVPGLGGYPIAIAPPPMKKASGNSHHAHEDIHLRSTQSVGGYAIETSDGTIGTVSGFLLDAKSWTIRELVVETGHWYSGKEILIPTGKVERISYMDSRVLVKLTKKDIEGTVENGVAKTLV